MVNGGYRKSRTLDKVWKDLMPFLQSGSDNKVEELERLRQLSQQDVSDESKALEEAGKNTSGGSKNWGNLKKAVIKGGALKTSIDAFKVPQREAETKEDRSYDGDGEGHSTQSTRRSTKAPRRNRLSSAGRRSTVSFVYAAAALSKEQKEEQKKKEKRHRMATLMTRHAARINTSYRESGTELTRKIENDETWTNESTEKINDVVRKRLPGHSIRGVRRFIDALRLISNFYIAIFICTFITGSHIAENMTPLTRFGNLVGLVTVTIANTVLDPIVTFEYATIR